ncbi:long-chain fatty acid--CoA ligase [Acrocarpospora macrocephala]|uniref:Putative fatty-acid-CoA ligase FadD n=1 Tax=Acrocarpospora macrocephala TaxID=150177 RepID=A0A5M3WMJ3_9ACTN|nr:class I adenylate-forming enzyme family protein [Acrocarpospora macrocephala]GES09379.1 putative fatty-acid-CoA ligase FadD [Acrocarpospora macrocephala]
MTQTGAEDAMAVDPYFSDPRLQSLIGPGGPFEVEEIILDGVPVRSFVRAPRTIMEIFQLGKAHADLVHLVYYDERWTFADVRRRALSTARELKTRYGVRPGDRVAIAMRNYPEFFIGFWATAALGAVIVPLNSWWTGFELAYALKDAGAKVVFADQERIERLASTGVETSGVAVVAVRTDRSAGDGLVHAADLMAGEPLAESEFADLGPDDPVTILYTSGTTGHPKGALGTNRGHIASFLNMSFMAARDMIITGRTTGEPRQPASIGSAPLFHIGGVAIALGGQLHGSKTVLVRKWDLVEALTLAEKEGVTSFGGVPTTARQILDYPRLSDYKLRLNGFTMGGAAVPPDLPGRALEAFGSVQLLNGYGSTETSSAVVANVGDEYAQHPRSIGRPNLTADLRVEDPDGLPVGPGQIGELCFRSPQIVKEYWNNPEATREAIVDGWFHTGDLGYVDEDGFVYVVDRLKDVVIRGGENVYCAEVEAILFKHPDIADAAVLGVPDPVMGERVCAVVVPRDGAEIEFAALRNYLTQYLAYFKAPEALIVTDEVPKTATGKIAKNELRKLVADEPERIQRI